MADYEVRGWVGQRVADCILVGWQIIRVMTMMDYSCGMRNVMSCPLQFWQLRTISGYCDSCTLVTWWKPDVSSGGAMARPIAAREVSRVAPGSATRRKQTRKTSPALPPHTSNPRVRKIKAACANSYPSGKAIPTAMLKCTYFHASTHLHAVSCLWIDLSCNTKKGMWNRKSIHDEITFFLKNKQSWRHLFVSYMALFQYRDLFLS